MTTVRVIWRPVVLRATLLVVCLFLAGCITHRSVESTHETIAAEVQPGDRLEIELLSGQKLNLRVLEIRDTELVGDTSTDITRGEVVTVPYGDIKQLERIFVDHKKTLIAAGGTAVSIVVLMIVGLLLAGATL